MVGLCAVLEDHAQPGIVPALTVYTVLADLINQAEHTLQNKGIAGLYLRRLLKANSLHIA